MRHRWVLVLASCTLLWGCSGSSRQIAILKDSPEPAKRLAAVEALGQITAEGEKRAEIAEVLSRATLDPDEQVREAAVTALGNLGGDEAKKTLLAVVEGKNYSSAQYVELQAADRAGGDSPELLGKLGQAQLEMGKDKDALRSFRDLDNILDKANPQQAMQQLYVLRTGYSRLRESALAAGNQKQVDNLDARLKKVDAKLDEAQAAGGGMGGFGGLQGLGGGLGGLPFSP